MQMGGQSFAIIYFGHFIFILIWFITANQEKNVYLKLSKKINI